LAAISVDGVNKNKTYINKVDIYDENEGPVRTRMKDDHTLLRLGYGSSYSPRCGPPSGQPGLHPIHKQNEKCRLKIYKEEEEI
jgi:hypothetical protein